MKEKIELSKSQIEAKKLMMKKLKSELNDLEFKVNHTKFENAKIKFIRSQLYILNFLKYFSPFIATSVVSVLIASLVNATPFVKDNVKNPLQIKKYLSSNGEKKYEQKYDVNEFELSPISYYGKWQTEENGLYSREIKTYSCDSKAKELLKSFQTMTEEEIISELYALKDTSIEEVFGDSYPPIKEYKDKVSEEELKKDAYIEVTLCSRNSDDFIVLKETASANFENTFIWFMLTLFGELLVVLLYSKYENNDFSYYVKKIKEKYPEVNIEGLKRTLEIKKNNYDRLTR